MVHPFQENEELDQVNKDLPDVAKLPLRATVLCSRLSDFIVIGRCQPTK